MLAVSANASQCASGVSTNASADMWDNVPMGSDSSLSLFHAKEMFVQLHKGFSEIIDHFRYIQIELDSEA